MLLHRLNGCRTMWAMLFVDGIFVSLLFFFFSFSFSFILLFLSFCSLRLLLVYLVPVNSSSPIKQYWIRNAIIWSYFCSVYVSSSNICSNYGIAIDCGMWRPPTYTKYYYGNYTTINHNTPISNEYLPFRTRCLLCCVLMKTIDLLGSQYFELIEEETGYATDLQHQFNEGSGRCLNRTDDGQPWNSQPSSWFFVSFLRRLIGRRNEIMDSLAGALFQWTEFVRLTIYVNR